LESKEEIKTSHNFDVIIVGGGLAGLTSAIHLSRSNISVLVIEKNPYPSHKVCGEYVSNEVLPYLKSMEIDPFEHGAKEIKELELSTCGSKRIRSTLPLGGFGISRYTFDNILAIKAEQGGAQIIQDVVTNIKYFKDEFKVTTKTKVIFKSKFVIGAYGKRSAIDTKMHRGYIKKKSPFLAVKIHVKGEHPSDLVALHNFQGGYCGVSKTESDEINLCYITSFKSFKRFKDIKGFQEQVVYKNKHLKMIFQNSTPSFSTPLSISQISFAKKSPVEQHVLMCGDTAGLIHPLCGNGMSMAIRSAQMISQLLIKYFNHELNSRNQLEKIYSKSWNKEFRSRLKAGRIIAALFEHNKLAEVLISFLEMFPGILNAIIKRTHGKPMLVK